MATHSLRLPRGWRASVRSAVLQAISLANFAVWQGRGRASHSSRADAALLVENDQLRQRVALLEEAMRIKDARMLGIPAAQRPRYRPIERLAILEVRAAQGWSLEQTAKMFLVTAATIAAWSRRLDEEGPAALLQLPVPVNKFPDLVHYLVTRLRVLCPTMGKAKIAQTLACAGLHLGATTVGRILKRPPTIVSQKADRPARKPSQRVVARRPNEVWHVDLTVQPIGGGLWTAWLPFALPQCWPFCWWLAVVTDQFSRRVMGTAIFTQQPTSQAVCALLGRAIRRAGALPRYLISDQGPQFDCDEYRRWCLQGRRKITPRYGAVGQHGSIAVVERCIRTVKEGLRRLPIVPMQKDAMRREMALFVGWYNEHRPHEALQGRTPNEVYCRRFPAARRPRYEPRACWPRGSPCARPWALVRGRRGIELKIDVRFLAGRRNLPVVTLHRAA